jgi:hypothetical protein
MSKTTAGLPATPAIVKAQARRLKSALADTLPLSHGQALELVAKTHGRPSWGALNAEYQDRDPFLGPFNLGYERTPELEPKRVEINDRGAWTSRDLGRLKAALIAKTPALRGREHRRMVKDLLRDGGIIPGMIPDLLFAISQPLGDMTWYGDVVDMVRVYELETRGIMFRPGPEADLASGHEWVPLEEVVRLLMNLERMGFDTFPDPLVHHINERLSADPERRHISHVELECLWYDRERSPRRWVNLVAQDTKGVRQARFEVTRLKDGDVMVSHYDAEDRIIHLEIFSADQYEPDTYGVELAVAVV